MLSPARGCSGMEMAAPNLGRSARSRQGRYRCMRVLSRATKWGGRVTVCGARLELNLRNSPAVLCLVYVTALAYSASFGATAANQPALEAGLVTVPGQRAPPQPLSLDATAFADATLYLEPLGINTSGLSELAVGVGKLGEQRVAIGQMFSSNNSSSLATPPKISWRSGVIAGATGLFTLLMLDPDAPHRAKARDNVGTSAPFLHWLLTGCTLNGESSGQVGELPEQQCKENAMPYVRPAPTAGNGRHRYILLLFQQLDERSSVYTNLAKPDDATSEQLDQLRPKWDLADFLEGNEGVLEPVAATFIYVSEASTSGAMTAGRRRSEDDAVDSQ